MTTKEASTDLTRIYKDSVTNSVLLFIMVRKNGELAMRKLRCGKRRIYGDLLICKYGNNGLIIVNALSSTNLFYFEQKGIVYTEHCFI